MPKIKLTEMLALLNPLRLSLYVSIVNQAPCKGPVQASCKVDKDSLMPSQSLQYRDLIGKLDDHTVYTAHTIMQFALSIESIQDSAKEIEHLKQHLYTRKSKANKAFFREDGKVVGADGISWPGYCGWRWRLSYNAFKDNLDARELFSRVGVSVPFKFSEAFEHQEVEKVQKALRAVETYQGPILAVEAEAPAPSATQDPSPQVLAGTWPQPKLADESAKRVHVNSFFRVLAWIKQSTRLVTAAWVLGAALLACGAGITKTVEIDGYLRHGGRSLLSMDLQELKKWSCYDD